VDVSTSSSSALFSLCEVIAATGAWVGEPPDVVTNRLLEIYGLLALQQSDNLCALVTTFMVVCRDMARVLIPTISRALG